MQLSSLECYATAKLNCGYADLEMLDNVYSKLAEDCCYDIDEIISRVDDLNELLYEVYWQVTSKVQDEILDRIDSKEPMELVINDKVVYFEITDEQAEKLKELAEGLTENSPFCNCLDTYFQNDLDRTVDWENGLYSNVEDLIRYWVESEKLQLEEEKEIMAYVLSEDGTDKDYEEYYTLRAPKPSPSVLCLLQALHPTETLELSPFSLSPSCPPHLSLLSLAETPLDLSRPLSLLPPLSRPRLASSWPELPADFCLLSR